MGGSVAWLSLGSLDQWVDCSPWGEIEAAEGSKKGRIVGTMWDPWHMALMDQNYEHLGLRWIEPTMYIV